MHNLSKTILLIQGTFSQVRTIFVFLPIMKIHFCLFFCFILFYFLYLSTIASAQVKYGTSSCKPNVKALGMASVTDRLVQDYKDEALYFARERAIEEKVGVYIDSETQLTNEILLESNIYKKSDGYIKCDTILREWIKDDIYYVKISADVNEGKLKDGLRKITPDDTVIVSIKETNMGKEVTHPKIQSAIINELLHRGYDVKDKEKLSRITKRDEMLAAMKGDQKAAREIALRFMSNILIIGTAKAYKSQNLEADTNFGNSLKGVKSARTTASFKTIITDTGSILCDIVEDGSLGDGVKGFAHTWESAGLRALNKLSDIIIEKDIKSCFPKPQGENRQIDIIFYGIPTISDFTTMETILKAIIWVKKVEAPNGWHKSKTIFKLLYPAKTQNISVRLDSQRNLKVTDFSKNRIVVKWKNN